MYGFSLVNQLRHHFEDQWYFLSSLKKVSPKEVDEIIKSAEKEEKIIEISKSEIKMKTKSSNKKISVEIKEEKLPEKVNIIIENMIYIEKKGIPSKVINELIRTAAFSNPEFYKAQAMRLPTYNKPRLINCSEVSSEYIVLPRGCMEEINEIFQTYNINICLTDNRVIGNPINIEFNGKLTDIQMKAAEKILSFDNGILCATTGFGKTVLGAWLIGKRKVNHKEISSMKEIEHIVITRKTKFEYEKYSEGKVSITEIYGDLIEDELRNDMIFNDVLNEL